MDARSIEPVTLTPEEAATHTVKTSWHDEAKTQRKAEWVVRTKDDVGDGRVVWYHPNGVVRQAGQVTSGVLVGPWRSFDTEGRLTLVEDFRDDVAHVQQFASDTGLVFREGIRRKDGAGQWRDDGVWRFYANGQPDYEDVYELGTLLGRRPPLEKLRAALREGRVKNALEKLASGNVDNLYRGVDGLLDEGFELTVDVARELTLSAWPHNVHRALRYLAPHAAALLPRYEEVADQLTKDEFKTNNSLDTISATRIAILLVKANELAHPGTPVDARFDELLGSVLRWNDKSTNNLALVELIAECVKTLPIERREAVVLNRASRHAWQQNTINWSYGFLAPTSTALGLALAAIGPMKKNEFTYGADRKRSVADTLSALATNGHAAALAAWLDGEGKKAPQRALVVAAVAEAKVPSLLPTLLAFADDGVEEAKLAARQGILALGAAARPGLEEVLAAKKSKLKALAEELLAQLPSADGAAPPAVVETNLPASLVAWRALAASASEETARFREALNGKGFAEARALFDEEVKKDAPRALAGFAPLAFENIAGKGNLITFDMLASTLAYRIDAHPGFGALLAELLYALPEKGSWNPKYAVKDRLNEKTASAFDTLGHLFEGRVPDTAKHFAGHLAEHHPWEARRVLLACATESGKSVRGEAVSGLVRCGARIVPDAIALLARDGEGLLSACEILRALPDATALPALEAALAKEKNKKRKEALEEALAVVRGVGGGAPKDAGSLDADLAARAAKRKKKTPEVKNAPAVRWKNADGTPGAAMSEGALKWLLGAIADENGGEPNAELTMVRSLLVDEDAAKLLLAIRESIPFSPKEIWRATYVFGILGDDAALELFGGQFQNWASSGAHGLASHGIETLRRNGSGRAIAWLDRWSDEGAGKVQKDAQAALERICADRKLDRDGLVDLTTPRAVDAAQKTKELASIRRRLEAAMIVGRSFGEAHFREFLLNNPLVAEAAAGLVVRDASGAFAYLDGKALVDAGGAPTTPAWPVAFPHPLDLADDANGALQDGLAALGLAQPFAQLTRPFTRDPKAAAAALRDQKLPTKSLLGALESLGYRRGPAEDAGIIYTATKPLAGGWLFELEHDGYAASTGRSPGSKDSTIRGVSARMRDRYDVRPSLALESEAVEELKKVLAS